MKRLLAFSMLALLLAAMPAGAQTGQTLEVEGLAIDPFLIETEVAAGIRSEYEVTLFNNTDKPLPLNISINDFVPVGPSNQPRFLDSSQTSDRKFSLSRWISVTQQPNFTIPAKGRTAVKFAITPPNDAEPGTHYGGILFGRTAEDVPGSATEVEQKVGTIILAKLGKADEKGRIASFISQHRSYQRGPVEFLLTFHNFGNVHARPKGDITIFNSLGKAVVQVPVNRDAGVVLPESERGFVMEWEPAFAFGRYRAEAVLFFGDPKIEVRAQTIFWVIPVKTMLSFGAGLAVLIALGYFAIRSYNRYIIKKSLDAPRKKKK